MFYMHYNALKFLFIKMLRSMLNKMILQLLLNQTMPFFVYLSNNN